MGVCDRQSDSPIVRQSDSPIVDPIGPIVQEHVLTPIAPIATILHYLAIWPDRAPIGP